MNKTIYEAPEAIKIDVDDIDVMTVSSTRFNDSDVLSDGWVEA